MDDDQALEGWSLLVVASRLEKASLRVGNYCPSLDSDAKLHMKAVGGGRK